MNPAATTSLTLNKVSFTWPGSRQFALQIDAFHMQAGEKVLLLGQSGSGKSTLLSLFAGIISPQAGSIQVAGENLVDLTSSKRDRFRAEHIGVIFQQFNLLPYGSVADNILLPLSFAAQRRKRVITNGSLESEALRLCKALQLPEKILKAHVGELSVGQQQRVAVARALIGQPDIILADEPTSALDSNSQQAFMDLLMAQVTAANSSLLMVSHDPSLANYFDRVIQLEDLCKGGVC